MSSTTVTCPGCQAGLRLSKPLTAAKTIRCPQCGHRFQAGVRTTALEVMPRAPRRGTILEQPPPLPELTQAELEPLPPAPRRVPALALAICISLFLVGGGITVLLLLTRERPHQPVTEESKPPPQVVVE